MSKKKTIYVWTESEEFDCTKAERVGTVKEFNQARHEAAIAADELRERGRDADVQTVYNALVACAMSLMYARTEITCTHLYASIRYIEDCKRANVAIFWPYVQDRILDFLEPEYISNLGA